MKITWNENPMKTTVELDEGEKHAFRLRLKVDELEEIIVSAHVELDPKNREFMSKHTNGGKALTLDEVIDRAQKKLNYAYVVGEEKYCDKTFDEHVAARAEHFLEELMGEHGGDCTCFPASCPKCYAEGLLGIDTIAGLGKHPGAKISSLFSPHNAPGRNIDEVIELLANYRPVNTSPTWKEEDFQRHVPRWLEEAKHAHGWLLEYKRTRLNKVL